MQYFPLSFDSAAITFDYYFTLFIPPINLPQAIRIPSFTPLLLVLFLVVNK
jgi:hypothetical protein